MICVFFLFGKKFHFLFDETKKKIFEESCAKMIEKNVNVLIEHGNGSRKNKKQNFTAEMKQKTFDILRREKFTGNHTNTISREQNSIGLKRVIRNVFLLKKIQNTHKNVSLFFHFIPLLLYVILIPSILFLHHTCFCKFSAKNSINEFHAERKSIGWNTKLPNTKLITFIHKKQNKQNSNVYSGPAIVRINLFVRSIATISDIKMVSRRTKSTKTHHAYINFIISFLYLSHIYRMLFGIDISAICIASSLVYVTFLLLSKIRKRNFIVSSVFILFIYRASGPRMWIIKIDWSIACFGMFFDSSFVCLNVSKYFYPKNAFVSHRLKRKLFLLVRPRVSIGKK